MLLLIVILLRWAFFKWCFNVSKHNSLNAPLLWGSLCNTGRGALEPCGAYLLIFSRAWQDSLVEHSQKETFFHLWMRSSLLRVCNSHSHGPLISPFHCTLHRFQCSFTVCSLWRRTNCTNLIGWLVVTVGKFLAGLESGVCSQLWGWMSFPRNNKQTN